MPPSQQTKLKGVKGTTVPLRVQGRALLGFGAKPQPS
jgi:hypothetical protein